MCCHGLGLAVAEVEEGVFEGAAAVVALEGFPTGTHVARVFSVGCERGALLIGSCVDRFLCVDEVVGCFDVDAVVFYECGAVGDAQLDGRFAVLDKFADLPARGALPQGPGVFRAAMCAAFFEEAAVGFAWDVAGNARVAVQFVLFLFLVVLA